MITCFAARNPGAILTSDTSGPLNKRRICAFDISNIDVKIVVVTPGRMTISRGRSTALKLIFHAPTAPSSTTL
jgi:hypothetical protein